MRGDPNRNLVAAISYLFGFVTGFVILLIEKDDKFVRYHATQSLLLFGAIFILNILINLILAPIDFLGVVTTLLSTIISIATIVAWAYSMFQAFNGKVYRWPIVGKMAERMVNKS